jgi:phage-related minor tail protein
VSLTVATLESLFTADISKFEQGAKTVETRQKAIDGKKTTAKIDADTTKAEKNLARLTSELDALRQSDVTPEVTADIAKAEASLSRVESDLSALRGAKAEMVVTADTSKAEGDLDGLADKAADAGSDGGDRAGKNLGAGILAAIATIPIAGAVVGIGQAIGQSLLEGLGNEVRADRLAASTGLDAASVARLGTAAGEAYASNFGDSIESNMETAQAAVQSGLLDPKATAQDAQAIIASLSGVADILGEDIPNVSRAAAQILKTGLAKDAAGAFDLIVKGQQAGLNASEDLLDTFNEYGTQFRKLGLEGPQALGLLSQAVKGGARDTDVAADALKEFAIRAVDDSELTAEGFEAVGLSAEDMSAKIAKGGPDAADALDQTLDGLRKIKDPADRSAAAVALFGTQAEDMGDALFKMDLSSAVKQLGAVEGAAEAALNTLGDNTAGKLESAKRNIEVAVDGIQGALATAFAPEIQAGADWVSQNREAVVSALFDMAEGALEFGVAMAESAASGTEAFGDFASTSLPPVIQAINAVVQGLGHMGLVSDEAAQQFADFTRDSEENLADFDESTEKTAEQIRTRLIDNALTPAQDKLKALRIPAEAAARLSDTTGRLATHIGNVGYAADGSKISLKLLNGEVDTGTAEGKKLDNQLNNVQVSLKNQVGAAAAAGESQNQLRGRVKDARGAFIDQVKAMGLTAGEANHLADQYGLIPKKVLTNVRADGSQAKAEARAVRDELAALKDQSVTITTFRKEVIERAQINDGRNRSGFSSGGFTGLGGKYEPAGLVHKGEWVLRQEATKSIESAAPGLLSALNQRGAKVLGLGGFAGGGAVGSAQRELAQQLRFRKGAAARVHKNRANDRRDDTALSARALQSAEERLAEIDERISTLRSRIERLSGQRADARRSLRRGDIRDSVTGGLSGALGVTDDLRDLAGSGDVSAARRRRLNRVAGNAEKSLTGLYKRAEQIDKKIASATDRFEKWKGIADGISSSISGAFSLGDVSGGVDPWSGQDKQATGSLLLAASLDYQAKARTLVLKLKALQKAGYGAAILREVAGQGVEGGAAMADALLQLSPADVKALQASQSAIDAYAASAGVTATNGNLASAQKAMDSYEAQARVIDKRIGGWAKTMGRELARALGIKARASGGPTMAGHAYLVNEDTPRSELFIPQTSGYVLNNRQATNALGNGGPSYTFNITNVHPVAEPASVTTNRAMATAASTGRF